MARARSRHGGVDYWPGFVDALSTLILGIVFLLSVFVIVQFVLSQEVTGKDTALQRLSARIAQLTDLLSLEQTGKLTLEEQIAQLRAGLAATEGERDRYKGLYEGLGSGAATAQGKVSELSTQLDSEKRISLRALAQVEVLNQQIAALRRQLGALEQALEVTEKRDKELQIAHHRARPAAEPCAGSAGAGAVALPLRLLRPVARNSRQPLRHSRRRRPLRVPVGGVLRHRPGRAQAGRPRRDRQDRRRDRRARQADPAGDRLGAARRRPHRRAADCRAAAPTGTCRHRARSPWCST